MSFLRNIFGFLIDAAQTLLLAFSVFLVVYIFIFRPYQVSGLSMYPNFDDKEYVLTNVIAMRLEKPKIGDIVVFKAPNDQEKDFIKRIIGTPGDTVYIKDGNIYINDDLLDQSLFLKSDVKTYGGSFMHENQPVNVPEDSYLVMGDNRGNSSDSREWGFVNFDNIIGKSFFVYFPFDKMRFIENPYN